MAYTDCTVYLQVQFPVGNSARDEGLRKEGGDLRDMNDSEVGHAGSMLGERIIPGLYSWQIDSCV